MSTILGSLPILMGAPAGGGGAPQGGPASILPTLITFGLVFLIFYFLIIRPQNKKQKETKAMLASLGKGDRVVTIGGIRGVIQSLKEDAVVLKVDNNTSLEFSKTAISNVLEKKASSKKKKFEEKAIEAEADDESESDDE
ncbi:MAG: preprotein translocase subunit YajC [Spirochaetia bacterium]